MGVAGGEEFVYQSCTYCSTNSPGGSMDGYFTFVEGTIRRQTGPSIRAVVSDSNANQSLYLAFLFCLVASHQERVLFPR